MSAIDNPVKKRSLHLISFYQSDDNMCRILKIPFPSASTFLPTSSDPMDLNKSVTF